MLSVTDPLGRRTAFTRDTKGNVTSVTRLAGSAQAATTSLSYVPTGGVGIRRIASITDPLGQATSFAYDSVGYPAQVTDPLGAHDERRGPWRNAAGAGRRAGPMRRSSAATTRCDVVAATDPLGRVTALGRDGGGRLVSRTNPLGKRVGYAYDRLDRLAQITDPAGGTTRFQHDPNGNLVTVTDARSKATRFVYDGMNRLVSRIDPLQRSESFTYDGNGNVTSATDRKGQVTGVTYDALDRPVTVSVCRRLDGRAMSGTPATAWSSSWTRLAGTITRAWDLHDRLTSETTALGTVAYSYDAGGATDRHVGGRPAHRRLRLRRGRPPDAGLAGRRCRSARSTTPPAAGPRWSSPMASPQSTRTTPRHSSSASRTGAARVVLGTLTYAYDAAGNRVRAGGTWARVGLPQPVASATHDDANRVLTFGGAALTHDANGNLTQRRGAGRIRGMPAISSWPSTGPGSRRASATTRWAAGTSSTPMRWMTRFLYDGVHAVEVFGPAGAVSLLGGLEVGEHLALGEPGDGFVPLTDALGSVLALSDEAGAVGAEYTYQPVRGDRGSGRARPEPVPVHRPRGRRHRPLFPSGAVLSPGAPALHRRESHRVRGRARQSLRLCAEQPAQPDRSARRRRGSRPTAVDRRHGDGRMGPGREDAPRRRAASASPASRMPTRRSSSG